MNGIKQKGELITKTLTDAGLKVGLEQLVLDLAFAHVQKNEQDECCAAYRSPNGSVLKLGFTVPCDIFISLERDDQGRRIHTPAAGRPWYAREWGSNVKTLPREIHFEQALELIKDMARAFMADR
jgi:hypothetical protein